MVLSLLLVLFLYVYMCLTIFSSQCCGLPRSFKGCKTQKLSFREVYVRSLVWYIEKYIFISSFIYLFLFVFFLLRMGNLQVFLKSLRWLSLFHLFFRRLWKHLFSLTSFTASFNASFQCIALLFKCWTQSKLICLPALLFYKYLIYFSYYSTVQSRV